MFPSAGYFRSANCPFFIHGLCHRPYCHFRHAKPGLGSSSKSAVKSCLKTTTTPTKTSSASSSQPSKTQTTEENNQTSTSSSLHHHDTPSTTITTNPQPATNSEPKSTTIQEQTEKNHPKVTQSKTPSILESLSKLEAAVEEASATLHSTQCTSKKLSDVINTKRARDPKKVKNDNGEDESVSEFDDVRSKVSTNQKAHDQAKIIADDSDLSIAKDKLVTNENEENLSNSSKTTESISYLKKNTIDSALIDTVSYQSIAGSHFNEQEFSSKEYTTEGLHLNEEKSTNSLSNEVHMKSNKTSNNTELNVVQDAEMEMFEDITNADGWIDADPPGVEIQSNSAGFEMKRKLEEDDKWFCTLKKKWKSSIEKEKSIKNIDKSKHKNNEVCSTNLDLETCHSKNIKLKEKDASRMDSMKNLTLQKLGSTDKEKHGKKSDSKNSNSTESITLQNSEKKLKAKRKLVDVDFFTSPKKAKTKSQDQEKSQKSSSLTSKPQQITDNVKLKTLRKHILPKSSKLKELKAPTTETKTSKMKVEKHSQSSKAKISQVPNDVNSLFESDEEVGFSSDSFSDSEPETTESGTDTLKEIFNSYNPLKEKAKKHKSASVAGVSGLMTESISPAKEVQGLVKKKRVAHNPSYLVQRKTSRINPVRQLPKSASSIPTIQPKPTPETNAIQPKKRVAHAPKPTTQTSLARPRIPIEYGAKVPQNLRQRYLDKIIDENLRLYATEKEAFDKGLEEEQSIYERATRRPMYLNLCCNAIKVLRSKPTPEFQHVPVPSPLRRASTSSTTTRAGASIDNTKQKTIDPDNLTEESTYELLSQYVLDEEQLVENGYPRQCPSTPGKVTFKTRKPLPTPSKDPNRRTCCRCGRRYSVREDGTPVSQEECVYHFGRLFKRRTTGEISTSYQCCGGDASTPGCSVCKYHVIEGKDSTDGFMTTIISPLGNQKKIFGMDCEMCYTTAGLELTRVTVVDWKLEKVYDTFVKPDNPILDYNTRFSGVTQECLRGVKTSIREVQAVLLSMISKDSILVGHSLESDLLALKLVHSTVVDTSVVFPHRLGPPYKRALRTLMAEFVKKIIQSNEEGHDSYEDASAALELMIFKIKEDLKIKDTKKQKLPTK